MGVCVWHFIKSIYMCLCSCAFHSKLHSAVLSDEVLDNSGNNFVHTIVQVYLERLNNSTVVLWQQSIVCWMLLLECSSLLHWHMQTYNQETRILTQYKNTKHSDIMHCVFLHVEANLAFFNFRWAHKNINSRDARVAHYSWYDYYVGRSVSTAGACEATSIAQLALSNYA